jgi:large subunit ribosomal protein LP0
MGREDRTSWKANYFARIVVSVLMILIFIHLLAFQDLLEGYPKCFLVNVDNVGSKQMQEIRQAMRGLFVWSIVHIISMFNNI